MKNANGMWLNLTVWQVMQVHFWGSLESVSPHLPTNRKAWYSQESMWPVLCPPIKRVNNVMTTQTWVLTTAFTKWKQSMFSGLVFTISFFITGCHMRVWPRRDLGVPAYTEYCLSVGVHTRTWRDSWRGGTWVWCNYTQVSFLPSTLFHTNHTAVFLSGAGVIGVMFQPSVRQCWSCNSACHSAKGRQSFSSVHLGSQLYTISSALQTQSASYQTEGKLTKSLLSPVCLYHLWFPHYTSITTPWFVSIGIICLSHASSYYGLIHHGWPDIYCTFIYCVSTRRLTPKV